MRAAAVPSRTLEESHRASYRQGRRLRRRRPHPVRQGGPEGRLPRDPRRRPGREGDPGAAAPQPRSRPQEDRRGRRRRDHADRRPGPDHRPHRRHSGGPAHLGPGLLHRPHVRGRPDRRHLGGRPGRLRRVRRRDRGRCRAHGPPPDGRGRRPEPAVRQREAGRRVRPVHGHDRGEPARPLPVDHQAARRRVRGALPGEGRQGLRQRPDPGRPGAGLGAPHQRGGGRDGLGPGHGRRADASGHHAGEPGGPEDAVPRARPGHRGQRGRSERRRDRLPHRERGLRPRAQPPREDAPGRVLLRGRRAGGHGLRPDPGHREGPRAGGSVHLGHRPVRDQRGLRRPGPRVPGALRHRRRRRARQPVRRRHRLRPPAGLLRRPADDAAGPSVRGAAARPLRPDHHVRRLRHGRDGHLGEPALRGDK